VSHSSFERQLYFLRWAPWQSHTMEKNQVTSINNTLLRSSQWRIKWNVIARRSFGFVHGAPWQSLMYHFLIWDCFVPRVTIHRYSWRPSQWGKRGCLSRRRAGSLRGASSPVNGPHWQSIYLRLYLGVSLLTKSSLGRFQMCKPIALFLCKWGMQSLRKSEKC
jgi:hypothetical protein